MVHAHGATEVLLVGGDGMAGRAAIDASRQDARVLIKPPEAIETIRAHLGL